VLIDVVCHQSRVPMTFWPILVLEDVLFMGQRDGEIHGLLARVLIAV
jgi:hypothetical protein